MAAAPRIHLGHLAIVYAVFAALSLLTALGGGGRDGEPLVGTVRSGTIEPERVRFGQTVGPVRIDNADTVLQIEVVKAVPDRNWAYVEVEVQDAAGTALLALGDQVWRDSGVDEDGAWSESVTRYTGHVVLDAPGDYSFEVTGETGSTAIDDQVGLIVTAGGRSTILFWVAGLTALAIAAALFLHHRRSASGAVRERRLRSVPRAGPGFRSRP